MSALKEYVATSKGGGLLEVESLDVPAGERVKIYVLDEDAEERPGMITAAWSASAFSSIWDDPEEDEAWKDL